VLGGKNKYIVNGKNESPQQVTEMFQSVQLNINNPNFLIMQGKITHVLNMKSNQILGMVEEAAGTRLYEDRKEKAIKVMEKKDLKLAQSAALLETEITPKLDDLREKKRSLLEFQKVSQEMEHLDKVVTAHQFVDLLVWQVYNL
jgi:structural maintenance of chromosome 2